MTMTHTDPNHPGGWTAQLVTCTWAEPCDIPDETPVTDSKVAEVVLGFCLPGATIAAPEDPSAGTWLVVLTDDQEALLLQDGFIETEPQDVGIVRIDLP
jgi:hypothetical protein